MIDSQHTHSIDTRSGPAMKLFALDDEVAALEARLPSLAGLDRLAVLVPLSWQLRQRDGGRAELLADESETLLEGKPVAGVERDRIAARLQLVRAEVRWLAAELEQADHLANAAMATFAALGDRTGEGDAKWLLAFIHGDRGDTRRRDEFLALGIADYRAGGDPVRVDASVARSLLYAAFGSLSATAIRLEQQFQPLGQGEAAVTAWAASARAIAASPGGDFGVAIGQFLQSYRAALESGQLRQAILAASNAADNFSILGNLDAALEWDELALKLARRTGWPSMLGNALMQTGNVLRLLGRCAEAEVVLREALVVRSNLRESNGYAITLGYLGDLFLDMGKPAEALEYFKQAETRARELGGVISVLRVWRGQAHAWCRMGQLEAASAKVSAALVLAREEGSPDEQIETLRVCAELHLHHSLGASPGSTAASAALHYLDDAMAVAATIPRYALPAEIFDLAASAHAANGDYRQAYANVQAAARARDNNRVGRARSLALAMQERQDFERARAESEAQRRRMEAERIHSETEYHRVLARTETQRAATLEETSRTLETLGKIGREMTARLNAGAVYDTLDRHFSELLDVTSFDVYLLEPSGQALRGVFGVEDGRPTPLELIAMDDPTAFTARCAREREEVVILKAAHEPCENLIAGTLHTLSLMFSPLLIGDRLVGVMSIQSTRPNAYSERERSIFRSLCAYAAIALENAAAYSAAENARHEANEALEELRRTEAKRRQSEANRTLLEAQLRESQKMEAVGTLAGGIAHDFNNTLATILGNAELARQDVAGNARALESLEEIRKAGSRSRDLVKQILSFSRRQPTERKVVALSSVIGSAERLLRATLPKRLVLDVNCADGLPLVRADASQIQQVVINLVTNAMQAIQDQPGRIGIQVDEFMLEAGFVDGCPALRELHTRHSGRTVRLTITDDGPGMDEATLSRIFEPFFTTKLSHEGTGLGLSVVHGIVQAHEGAIVVESTLGHGCTFAIHLPAAETESVAASELDGVGDRDPASPVPEADPLTTGPRVLYLDDDESMVSTVKRLIERRGYRVSGYSNQRAALAALAAGAAAGCDTDPYQLLVTDYNMPGMSGLDVAREVRAIDPMLPVAIASGFIDEALRAQAEGAGVKELLFKAGIEEFCDAFVRLISARSESSASRM